MKKFAIVLIALFSIRSSYGQITIDGYGYGQILPGSFSIINVSVSDGDILGGIRNVQTFAVSVFIDTPSANQFLAFNNSGASGSATLTYAGSTGAFNGLGDVDLTQGGVNNCFSIDFTAANNKGGSLTLTAENIRFVGSTVTVPLPTSPGVLDIPFASFQIDSHVGDTQPVNFSDVGYIQETLQMNNGESYTMSPLEESSVPEPSSALILISGVFTAACLKKRTRLLPNFLR